MCSSTLEDYLDSWGFAKQKFSSSFHDKSHAKKNKINKSQAATHMSKNSIPKKKKKNLFPFLFHSKKKKIKITSWKEKIQKIKFSKKRKDENFFEWIKDKTSCSNFQVFFLTPNPKFLIQNFHSQV